MLDDDFVQTRKSSRQDSSPDLVIMQKPNDEDSSNTNHADTTDIDTANEGFNSRPATPQPTHMIMDITATKLSYHHTTDDTSFCCTQRSRNADNDSTNSSNITGKMLPVTATFSTLHRRSLPRRQSATAAPSRPSTPTTINQHPKNRQAFINAVRTAQFLQQQSASRGGIIKRQRKKLFDTKPPCKSFLPTWITTKIKSRNSKPVLVVKQRHNCNQHQHQCPSRIHKQQFLELSGSNRSNSIKHHYPYHRSPQDVFLKFRPSNPPITAEALSELSIPQLFKSLQIRHDLLLDPNLTFRPNLTEDKRHEAEMYWLNLDLLIKKASLLSTTTAVHWREDFYQLVYLARNIVTELALILVSLIAPFPTHPDIVHFVWHWPQEVTESSILSVFDPDLVQQQLLQGCFDIESKFDFVYQILSPLCPEHAERIYKKAMDDKEYGKAIELVFLTLETIKLDCANKALQHYRPYLLDTGTSLELKLFLNHLEQGEIDTTTIVKWLSGSWKALGKDSQFINAYYTGVLDLLTNDVETCLALNVPLPTFPISFSYDEKRFKQQLRHEFQNTIVIGILLMPYRLLAGKHATSHDLLKLKSCFSKLLKDASLSNGRVSCFHLALQACLMAKQSLGHNKEVTEEAKYWSNWINQNLKNTSDIYRIMYLRLRSVLLNGLLKGSFTSTVSNNSEHATMGLEAEITKLGQKLILMTDYNLRTFYPIYNYLLPTVCHKLQE